MMHWRRTAGAGFLGSAALAAFLFLPSRPGEGSKPGDQIMIISTASVRGEVSPCG